MMTAKEFVSRLFAQWEQGDQRSFFDALADDVRWTTIGKTPISGTYMSKAEYLDQVYRPIMGHFDGPVQCQVKNIIAEGNTVVVQWRGETPTRAGPPYIQDYCWVIQVEGDKIKQLDGYFDTAAVFDLLRLS